MKSKHIAALCLLFLTGLFTACSESVEETESEAGYPVGSLVLRLRAGSESSTRTQLDGSDGMHHVRQVYAILYRGDGTNASETKYVSHRILDWNPMEEGGGNDIPETREFAMGIPASASSETYTVLCVGLDDESGSCYGLNMTADEVPSFCHAGSTLADAKAVLVKGKSMTEAELFAGWETFVYSSDKANVVNVEMFRRVAGAYAYLKDIPVSVNGIEVKAVRLVLGNRPPTEMALARVRTENANDFGTGVLQGDEAKVLDRLNLKDWGAVAGSNGLYEFDVPGFASGALFLRAYLLPMAPGENATLSVELLGGNEGEEDVVLKSFPTEWNDVPAGGDKQRYAVYPNYIYHVGTRGAEEDRPMSLAGYRLELVVQPWTTIDIATEFPDVPIDASIDMDDYGKNPLKYIYDSNTTTGAFTVYPSLMKKDWKLTIVAESKYGKLDPGLTCDWLYFVMPDGSYSQEYHSFDWPGGKGNEEAVTVQFRMNDFVEKRTYPIGVQAKADSINNDIRCARFVLQTAESSSSVYLPLKQYNTITVSGQYKYGAVKRDYECGISRFDMEAERDRDGRVTKEGEKYGWGFWESAFFQIHQPFTYDSPDCEPCYDGEVCYLSAKKNEKGFPESIIDISRYDRFEWDGNNNVTADDFWYLPSQLELYSFFEQIVSNNLIESHVVPGELYWSGTAYCDARILASRVRSYGQRTGNIDKDYWELRQNNPGRIRRACKFKQK